MAKVAIQSSTESTTANNTERHRGGRRGRRRGDKKGIRPVLHRLNAKLEIETGMVEINRKTETIVIVKTINTMAQ